jgi:hypothetical protein
MGLRMKVILTAISVVITVSITEAAWQGPAEVISGTWGANNDQFGIEHGDTDDDFAGPFYLLSDGTVIIRDIVNGRRKIYSSSGVLVQVIKCQRTATGDWNEECRIYGEYIKTTPDGNIWVLLDQEEPPKYVLRSPTGQLIRTSTTRPSELGVVSENALAENQYKITITYPDKTYDLASDATFMKYVRDTKGNVYGVNDGGVWRFNQCGKEVAELLMPVNQTETITSKTGGKTFSIPVEYGQPVVASNGDVYTWKKSRLKYRIVKWTWQDDPTVPSGPDAPSGLTVTPSTTGLYLAWTASAQDPGCVTGYEIARATTSGGVFSTVGTVDKGVIKFNDATAEVGTQYYYKVRAKAGTEYSPYTVEVSGKR